MKHLPKISTYVADRIRGCLAIALTLTCYTAGNYSTDKQWQVAFVIAGTLYFLTSLAIVFKDVDTFES